MKVLKIGFVEPTLIYDLTETKAGKLKLKLNKSIPTSTIKQLAEDELPLQETVLVDSAYPYTVSELEKLGYHVATGRIERRT